ncbi:helix-turn-helix domain-containing protein [Rhizobiaceae bacterium n13]|uniref:Helix-turn-helix domain-containing protein n=1 Tax=Ferirhizobium litorale TaxID=2927786 RepID=A0AAE3U3L0_9HYPH|nr:helix-turn-helix domain-containing protein [Fererhizobium litorale]MDI7861609.1 helix-turn-helix domain-containing protein [Fererhizobium litorale]MDI7922049.1 helix-turn-helix domain-containing protein [Fererhizobium litorale]
MNETDFVTINTQITRPPVGTMGAASSSNGQRAPTSPVGVHLPSYEYSTAELAPGDQFAAWRSSLAPMLELVEPCDKTIGFDGRQTLWDMGSLVFARIRTDGFGFTSLPGHVRRDPLDHWTMTLLLHGNMTTDAPRRTFAGGAGVVQVHALGKSFSGHITDSEMLVMFVPREFCQEMAGALDAVEFSSLDSGMGRLFADYMIGLAKRLSLLDSADLPALVAATRAMILACVSMSRDHVEGASDPISTVLLERARRVVQTRLLDARLDAETLRRELGISRTRLYRMFEPSGGVRRYIQHRRLLDAHSALSDPNDPRRILDIAEERGFTDGAEFSRAFKREFGYSPSDVRMGIKGKLQSKPSPELQVIAPEARLGILLRRLQGLNVG